MSVKIITKQLSIIQKRAPRRTCQTQVPSIKKKIQEFALGTGVMFHILFKSDENNAQKSIFFMNMFHMSLSLETNRFRRETWRFKKSLLTK